MYSPLSRDTPPQMADGHCSGRYAPYWKAFLFLLQTMNMHEKNSCLHSTHLLSLKLCPQLIDLESELVENADCGMDLSKMIPPLVLTDGLMTLSHLPNADTQEAEVIIMETLFDAHHPCIGEVDLLNFLVLVWCDLNMNKLAIFSLMKASNYFCNYLDLIACM